MIEIRKPDATLARILPKVSLRSDTTYIPSRYALPFEHSGKQYVFQNLTKQCIEGTLPPSAKAGEGYDDLITAQFLVPEDKDECACYKQISALIRAYTRMNGIRGYTILPTLGCNARCIYCYQEGMQQAVMTPETVEQTIRFILDTHEGHKVDLSWFGGEPLLGARTIDRICEGLREAGLEYKSFMVSNGSLITPGIVSKMTDDWMLAGIQISMDGAEQDYIFRKHFYTGQDYYHRVMEAVSWMSEAGISVTIRCNVDLDNWERIPQFLSDLNAGVANKENVGVYLVPLNAVRMSEKDVIMWEKIRDARHLIEAAGFRPTPFMGLGLGFRSHHCMADCGCVVICPDGSLYACEHLPSESRFGDIRQGVTDEAARKEFCRVDRVREKCKKCPFLPDCTAFAACPVQDKHCRAVRELMAADTLKRMVDQQESEITEGENPIC